MKNRTIALITDFGLADAYVGAMKGVILSIVPSTTIVDITHDVLPQKIDQAAYLLWSSFKFFPKGTIFVCVIDPGVGSERKILCVETDDYLFLAPDNGILKYIFHHYNKADVFEVSNEKYFADDISSTFHGRDIFAPVAAHLADGVSPSKLGDALTPEFGAEWFNTIDPGKKGTYRGKVLHIDRFGNLITDFMFENEVKSKLSLNAGTHKIINYFSNYAEATGHPFMIRGSSKLLEVSLRNNNAANFLRANVNQKLLLFVE